MSESKSYFEFKHLDLCGGETILRVPSDSDMTCLLQAFEAFAIACTYHPDTVHSAIVERAEEVNKY